MSKNDYPDWFPGTTWKILVSEKDIQLSKLLFIIFFFGLVCVQKVWLSVGAGKIGENRNQENLESILASVSGL